MQESNSLNPCPLVTGEKTGTIVMMMMMMMMVMMMMMILLLGMMMMIGRWW